MKQRKTLFWLTLIVAFIATVALPGQPRAAAPSDDEEPVLVGRISHVEGELLRFVPDEKDWVATVKDAPFGMEDALYSGENTRAEFIMPNNTWVRIGPNTQVQLIALKPDVTEIDLASGVGRFYNRSADGVIKVTTPFGYVMADPGSSFDLYAGDESVEVITLTGDVSFIHDADQSRYDVQSGAASLIADNRMVSSGEGNIDADWDDWNASRNSLWAKRFDVKGDSTQYLPEGIQDDAYSLEENGRWEQVQYEGQTRNVWRPTTVAADWTPFSAGRWTVYYGDPCWVPDEPFGYVTHHYGNWILVGDAWYWTPPVARVAVAAGPVGVGIGFGWYPGRVGWLHSESSVAWVPLAPDEVYYSHRYWGRRSMVVADVNVARININVSNYRFVNRAVVINQTNIFSVNNYYRVRETHITRTTIINNFRPAPVVNNTVIRNYNSNRSRYNFTNVNVVRKPHQTVIGRIERNEKLARQDRVINARHIEQQALQTRQGRADRAAAGKMAPPRVTSRMVDAKDVNKPQGQVKFQQNELKRNARTIDQSADKRVMSQDQKVFGPKREGKTSPAGQMKPARPGQGTDTGTPARPGQSDTMRPTKPGQAAEQPGQPRGPREDTGTVKPGRPGQPETVTPARPGQTPAQPGQPRSPREDTGTVKPGRPGQTTEQPGRPARPGQPETVTPARPGQTPAQPGQPRSPREDTGTVKPGRPGQTTEQPGSSRQPREDTGNTRAPRPSQDRSIATPPQSPRQQQMEPQRPTPSTQRPTMQERTPATQQRPQMQERTPTQQQRPQMQQQSPMQQQRPQQQMQHQPQQQQQRPQQQMQQQAPKQQQQQQQDKGKKKGKDGKEE